MALLANSYVDYSGMWVGIGFGVGLGVSRAGIKQSRVRIAVPLGLPVGRLGHCTSGRLFAGGIKGFAVIDPCKEKNSRTVRSSNVRYWGTAEGQITGITCWSGVPFDCISTAHWGLPNPVTHCVII